MSAESYPNCVRRGADRRRSVDPVCKGVAARLLVVLRRRGSGGGWILLFDTALLIGSTLK